MNRKEAEYRRKKILERVDNLVELLGDSTSINEVMARRYQKMREDMENLSKEKEESRQKAEELSQESKKLQEEISKKDEQDKQKLEDLKGQYENKVKDLQSELQNEKRKAKEFENLAQKARSTEESLDEKNTVLSALRQGLNEFQENLAKGIGANPVALEKYLPEGYSIQSPENEEIYNAGNALLGGKSPPPSAAPGAGSRAPSPSSGASSAAHTTRPTVGGSPGSEDEESMDEEAMEDSQFAKKFSGLNLSDDSGKWTGDQVYTLIEKIENSQIDIHSHTFGDVHGGPTETMEKIGRPEPMRQRPVQEEASPTAPAEEESPEVPENQAEELPEVEDTSEMADDLRKEMREMRNELDDRRQDINVHVRDDDYERYDDKLVLTYLFDNMPNNLSFSKFKQPLRNACRITLLGNLEEGLNQFKNLKEQRIPDEYKDMIEKNIRDIKYYLRGKYRSPEAPDEKRSN